MKYVLLTLVLIAGVAIAIIVFSDSAKPGEALYFVDRGIEPLEVSFIEITKGQIAKAEKYVLLAEERLEELGEVVEGEATALTSKAYAQDTSDPEISDDVDLLLTDYEEHIEDAISEAESAQDEGEDADEVLETIVDSTLNNQETLLRVYDQVPEQAQQGIMTAFENCEKQQEKAMNKITNQHREEVKAKIENKKEEVELKKEEKKQDIADKKEAQEENKDDNGNNGNDAPGNKPEDVGNGGQPDDAGNSGESGNSGNGGQ